MSHISKTGSAIIFDSMKLIIKLNGMINKKMIARAINFLVFPRWLTTAAIIHRKMMEANAIKAPIENTSFTFIKLLSKNK